MLRSKWCGIAVLAKYHRFERVLGVRVLPVEQAAGLQYLETEQGRSTPQVGQVESIGFKRVADALPETSQVSIAREDGEVHVMPAALAGERPVKVGKTYSLPLEERPEPFDARHDVRGKRLVSAQRCLMAMITPKAIIARPSIWPLSALARRLRPGKRVRKLRTVRI